MGLLARMASESVDLVVTDPPYQFARGSTYFRTWFTGAPRLGLDGHLPRAVPRPATRSACLHRLRQAVASGVRRARGAVEGVGA
jgi:hypothetical protein